MSPKKYRNRSSIRLPTGLWGSRFFSSAPLESSAWWTSKSVESHAKEWPRCEKEHETKSSLTYTDHLGGTKHEDETFHMSFGIGNLTNVPKDASLLGFSKLWPRRGGVNGSRSQG